MNKIIIIGGILATIAYIGIKKLTEKSKKKKNSSKKRNLQLNEY